jgi:hypothetical protein
MFTVYAYEGTAMSRGLGLMQRYLMMLINAHGKPVTFAELRGIILKANGVPAGDTMRQSPERSLRRALHSLVRDQALIALGGGGRADPHRYFLNPMMVAMGGNQSQFDAVIAALKAES